MVDHRPRRPEASGSTPLARTLNKHHALVAESVDAPDSKFGAARRAGSIPAWGTNNQEPPLESAFRRAVSSGRSLGMPSARALAKEHSANLKSTAPRRASGSSGSPGRRSTGNGPTAPTQASIMDQQLPTSDLAELDIRQVLVIRLDAPCPKARPSRKVRSRPWLA